MNNYSGKFLNKFGLVFVLAMVLSACGGGGSDPSPAPTTTPTPTSVPDSSNVAGGAVDGPLANAVVTVYAFDASKPGFKGAVVAAASTDASTAITGLDLPLPLKPPYIMEVTSVAATVDITTGVLPVLTTLRTIITQPLLDSGIGIYATPLTTLALDIAVMSAADTNGIAGIQADEFETAITLAVAKVVSTLGFGLDNTVDIVSTPPLINSATISIAEQAKVAQYRAAVAAITAIAYQISQQFVGVTADTVLADLAADLADNNRIDGSSGSTLNANTLQVLQQHPSSLAIPNTSPVQTVADVQAILAAETAITGSTTATTKLLDGTIVTQLAPARTNVDSDGDGVFNADDDLPDNQFESVDSDGDGIGDNADPDDDNDGILDEDEGLASVPAVNDIDGDGIVNGIDNCPGNFNPAQANSDTDADGDACDLDDDGDGVNDVNDAFPNDASKFIDTDSDGIDDGTDADDDNDGIADGADVGVGQDGSTSCSLLVDCDGDGVLDGVDADRTDPGVGLNFGPVTNNDVVTVNEDAAVFLIDVTANDIDTTVILTGFGINDTSLGTLAISGNSIEYTPVANSNGTDTFTYTVTDGTFSSQGSVTVTIVAVNDSPLANDDTVTTNEDIAVVIADVTVNDVDVDGDVLTATLLEGASNGSVVDNGDGTFTYTPNVNFNGNDSFTYTVSDANGGIVTSTFVPATTGTVDIFVSPINDNPFANNDTASVNEGQSVNVNLAANDTDIDNALDLASIVITFAPSNGALVLNANGTVDYTHDGSETIADSFTYTIKDSSGAVSNVARVMLTINPLNDAPVANNDSASVNKGQSVNINLAANDTDAEGAVDLTSIVILTAPANGTYAVNTNGTVDYTHDGSVAVTDVFTYTIQDTSGAISNVANVVLNVSTLSIGAIANAQVDENSIYTSVTPTITGTPIGAVTYSLSGIDAADFTINASTGVVNMVARDFELPADADTNNVYVLTITATDTNNNTASQSWTVTVQDAVEVSAFSLAAIANVNLNENSVYTSVIPALSGDAPIGAVLYTLGGTDATLFTINSSSGVVSMVARDFELPVDASTDNIYELSITATDADGNTASEAWNVTVTDVTETATFTINTIANTSVNENSVYTGVVPAITGAPIGAVSYALGGVDAALFTINSSSGVVSMVARDFESPADTNTDNIYDLSITAIDADANTAGTSWSVTVTNVIETATFTINTIANANVNENSIYTGVVPAITGAPIGVVTYTLGGPDATLFTINSSSGVVNMVARDFELPIDADTNNVYSLGITATDADGNTASEAWNVTVVDVTETATFTINTIADTSVNENSGYTSVTPVITGAPIGVVTYTLSGIDAADFTINASTGVVSMVARDFESPADADTNNVYALTITATDTNNNTASQSWMVNVLDIVEVSAFSLGAIANVNISENNIYTSVIPVITGAPIGAVTYTLTGTDAADFTINASTGVVSMVARDFENPADANADNIYDLSITAIDADGNTASASWSVTVADVTENATFIIDTIANASVNENSVYNGVVPTITGAPIGVVTYTLGGPDATLFTINSSSGVVNMVARDFELPIDADANNVYALAITATDADGNSASEAWNVMVVDVIETATFTINTIANTSVNENSGYTSVTPTIAGTPIGAVTYSLAGTDASDFTINATTGVVSMVARDFENPADANADNIYDLSITTTDADGNTAGASWSVTVADVTETATFTINTFANASVNENSGYTSVTPTITGAPIGAVTYTLSGTDDADFTINITTGVVSMVARDFESPADADANNVYAITITATDTNNNTASQSWEVSVQNVVEVSTFSLGAISNVSLNENSVYTSVIPVLSGDAPIGIVTYTLTGIDAADFTINASTGVVSMVARDFENPADANTDNIYDLSITATDADSNTTSTSWSVTVVDVFETATYTINTIANANVNENSIYTGVVPAITGTPIGVVTYTLGGPDATLFTINSSSGVVNMVARDFESPTDTNTDNIYDLSITATDADGNTTGTSWSVTVADVTETATYTINTIANASVNENTVYTGVVPAITGTPIGALSYTLGGTDTTLFTINSNSGVVSMVVRDFESPVDANTDNIYELSITATDADGNTASEAWNVTVTDVIETATYTINTIANASVNENSGYTSVTPTITGTPIGAVTYTLSGIDAADFTINATTGVVSMVVRDFELPADADANNVYALTITATDTNNNTASQSWTVGVQDVIEVSAFSLAAIADVNINENSIYTSVTPVLSGDAPIGTVTYNLGGTDASLFTINSSSGVVSMVARDFENPADVNTDNIYDLSITAMDADGNTAGASWSVTVTDVTETATFIINTIANTSVNENSVYTGAVPTITGVPIGIVTYSLAGIDAADFTINASTGVVSMVARDFESPADANTDNIYDLSITATDADGNTASASWSVTVTDVIETATYTINTIANASVDENSVYTGVTPTIAGTPIGAVTYSLAGTDAADFTINASTGAVNMVARDFEGPADTNTDNIYDLSITATDADGNTASASWSVTVADVTETATFTINTIANASVSENSIYTSVVPAITGTPIGAVTYALAGADAADFSINASTGIVSMVARDFESPADANTDNIYDLSITATDADGNTASASWSVTVTDIIETATFTINTIANASINENSVYTGVVPAISGTPIGAVTYALAGIDAADFTINASTGVVSMVARDFELPVDADTNNVYALAITATDLDGNTASEAWNVTITDVTETATFTINTIANASVNENNIYTSVVPSISGTPIGAVTYALAGADAADFTINASTGVVSMVARDFELPVDANADNIYSLSITATDADGNTASEAWSVTVTDVIETATFTINTIANASVNENSVYAGVTPVIMGAHIGAITYTLSGTDAASFTINASTGVVSMVARDFEGPADANTDNIYNLSITAADADGNTAGASWNVTVIDVNETATFTINTIANASISENSIYTSVVPVISGTPIGEVTYTLSGIDATDFTINAATGVVNMVARDFELPVDANADNIYSLSITATDADGNTASEAWSVTVTDVIETATFTINTIANTSVNENSVYTSVTPTITGTPIGALTYTLSGTDAASFTINASTGVVSMVARDFELPADVDVNNDYALTITATDANNNTATQSWTVSVQDAVEISVFSIGAITNVNLNENSVYTSITPVLSGDAPIGAVTYALAGVDAADFTINTLTGVASMVARDFESPADANTDNIYDLSIIATDEDGNSASQSWSVSVQNVVELLAVDDSAIVNEGQSVNINLAINDIADNVLNLNSIVIASPPSNAALVVNSNGTVDYIHDGSETIADLFTYTIRDTSGAVSNIATVRVTIIPVNNIPVANDDNVTTTVDTTVVVSNVLANDTDSDGDVLSVSLPTPNTAPTNGLVSYNGSGTFTYSPNTGFIGTDSFTYTVTDSIDFAVGTVTITVTPPGTPIDIVTLMSAVEGGVAGIENAEENVYAYWTDNYNLANSVFLPEDRVYNHLTGVFDTVVNNGDLLLSGTQWVSEGGIIGTDDGNGGLDLTILDANNINVEVARFKLTARFQDLNNVRISDHLNTAWQLAMVNPNTTFNAGAKLITDYRFEALVESHLLGQETSCQKDGTTKFSDLNGNCNSVDVDVTINASGYAQLLNDVVATTAWVDPSDFTTPPGAVTIATNNETNKTLMVQLVSGGAANYYVVDWNSSSAFAFVANAVAGADWVQNTDAGVDMIHFQVPASFITQFSDDLGNGLNNFLTVQNGYVRQGLKHAIGDSQFSDGQFNGKAFTDILANFSAPVIPGLAELTGTWVNSVASANGDPALIHIFANGNYESSGSCDLDGSTGMEYGTVSSSGSTANIIALAQIATQGLCGPSQGNKTLIVNGDVLTLSEPGFADVVYNRLLGTPNPIVGSWLLGNIQDPGEAHTILTMLDDTIFTLSQDCTADSASGFEYGTYLWDQGNMNDLSGILSIDSNAGCGLHNNTALSISGFTVTVLDDTLTLTDAAGGSFVFTRISPAYVIPMLTAVYTLDNLMLQPGDGQITGSFTWSYVAGDFLGGSGQFTDLNIPGYGTDIAALNINFDIEVGIEITLAVNTNNNGLTITLNFVQPLSPTAGSPIDLATSAYEIEVNGLRIGEFVSGAILLQ